MATRIWSVLALATFAMNVASPAKAATGDLITEKVIERADLSATVYTPSDGKSHPALLILGGAEGGRDWADAIAKHLAQEGYIAMAESYFKGPGLPDQLENIPLERLQAGVDYLVGLPSVVKNHLAVIGLSKGAEAALVLASHDDRVKAVVAASPSDVVWQGIDRKGGAPGGSWTFHGEGLAYVPFKACIDCKGLLDLYRKSRSAEPIDPAAVIAVEHIDGPVLLISSAADRVWPSTAMAHSIAERLRHAGFAFKVIEVDYPEGGHFAFGIAPTQASAKEDAEFGGGIPDGLAKARKDSWKRVSAFLASTFATTH
jgi:dienelactone hydrolase